MTDPNKTLIVTILDRSGSMSSIRADMEGGFKTFIAEQKALPGECLCSLYQFDNKFEVVYENKPIAAVDDLMLIPRGGTALLDAVGSTIALVGEQLAALAEEKRPGAVVIQIITDGQENSSKEYKLADVKASIERQQKEFNWQFLYLGVQDSTFNDAKNLGIAQAAMFNASGVGVRGMYSQTSEATKGYRASVRGGDLSAKIDLGNKTKKGI